MTQLVRLFAVRRTADGRAQPLAGTEHEAEFDPSALEDLVRACLGYTGPTELGEHDQWDWYLHPLPRRMKRLAWSDCHDPRDVMAGVSALAFEVATRRRNTVWDTLLTCARDASSGELLATFWQLGITVGQQRVFVDARSMDVITEQGGRVIERREYRDNESVRGIWSDGRAALLRVESLPHPCEAPERLLGTLTSVCQLAKRRRGRIASQRGAANQGDAAHGR